MTLKDRIGAWISAKNTSIDYEEVAKQAEAQAALQGTAQVFIQSGGTASISHAAVGDSGYLSSGPSWLDPHTQNVSDVGLIFMRMQSSNPKARGNIGYPKYFDHVSTHRYTDDKVAVFVCNNGSYVVLEDNIDLFPSDALITQLRMIQK